MSADLLFELGTEELPPKALVTLSAALVKEILDGLRQANLGCGASDADLEAVLAHQADPDAPAPAKPGLAVYAAPRRLAVLIHDVVDRQDDVTQERRGPALNAAFDAAGKPSKAALGFAKSCGVGIDALEKLETDKGSWLVFKQHVTGKPVAELLPDIIRQALAKLPIPKRMRWGDRDDEFVRPVHWAVLLHGDKVIDADILGARAGRATRGHRFHHPATIELAKPADYAEALHKTGHVIADFAARRAVISEQVKATAKRLGGEAIVPKALLNEVTALVEWPVAITGGFDKSFLNVPAEALMSSMMQHQKYFPVVAPVEADKTEGPLMPNFIAVANIDSKDVKQVRAGNERVIRPRLADAKFFFDQDNRISLADRRTGLKNVVFQDKLGTLFEKSERIAALARHISESIGADGQSAARAGELCKCDLLTDMVGEFPELQGIMGRYYAAGVEGDRIATAIEEHYMPIAAGAPIPATATGRAVALADKLDTLTGIFAIGQKPSGDKDPFGLRRAALGALRIIIEGGLMLDLADLLKRAARAQPAKADADTVAAEVFDYMMERLRGYYLDGTAKPDAIEAVLACRPTQPLDFDKRLRAVTAFRALPAAESLAAANKRIRNILKQANGAPLGDIDSARLAEPAERNLAETLGMLRIAVEPLFAAGDYTGALTRLAELREPVDKFFDDVMVMADDVALRNNRLALLNALSGLFLRVADVSRLQE